MFPVRKSTQKNTLPSLTSEFSPEKLPGPNRKGLSSFPTIFAGENSLLNFGGVIVFVVSKSFSMIFG